MTRSIIRPTIVAPGVFMLPRLRPDGRLLEVDLKLGGVPVDLPRLAAIDHGGRFVCMCGDGRACREHNLGFLQQATAGWWARPVFGGVGGYFQPFIGLRRHSFVRSPWEMPRASSQSIGAAGSGRGWRA
jgi:hypothetical protein